MSTPNRPETANLVVGWRAIGSAVGKPARYLVQAHCEGRLPFAPMKIGAQVAMSADMIKLAREALAASGTRRAAETVCITAKDR